jgi:hypothetical protein
MIRRIRLYLIAVLLVASTSAMVPAWAPLPAQAAGPEASPVPDGGDDPSGGEGGDADEVLIRTNPNRPLGGTTLGAARPEASSDSVTPAATSWWLEMLHWLGIRS